MKSLLVVLLVSAFASTAEAASCRNVAIAKAQSYGANPTSLTEEAVSNGMEGGGISGWRYWMHVDVCAQGMVVVDLTEACGFKQIYTRWGCRVAGVPNF
mgnify:CR=1 FL=1